VDSGYNTWFQKEYGNGIINHDLANKKTKNKNRGPG